MAVTYKNIHVGKFKARLNRFIAKVEIDGEIITCHVKNTGRCRELLTQDAIVYLEKSDNSNRKTAYDLIAVEKGNRLINMDSQVPNKAVAEWIKSGNLLGDDPFVKPECTFENSRFDFYAESKNSDRKAFVEVKGCTLENDGVCMFPDAPTLRGVKHIEELIKCVNQGYEAYIFFLIQMNDVKYFTPNYVTHKEFGETLKKAEKNGVKILAYDSMVMPNSIEVNKPVPIKL